MTVFLRNKEILLSSLLPSLAVKEIDFEKFKKAEGLYIADPWERVKSIFTVDDFGNWHPELIYTLQMTQIGAVTGGIFGGIIQGMKATEKFLHTTDTQIFANQREAQRALRDCNFLAVTKGACKWAPSFALFCGGFIFISSCCELYFNECRVFNHTIAGTSVGALFKITYGIRGIVSGGIIGGLLGTIYGFALWGAFKLSNTDNIQYKYAHFAYSKYRHSLASQKSTKNIFDNPSVLTDLQTSEASDTEENSIPKNEETEKVKHDKESK